MRIQILMRRHKSILMFLVAALAMISQLFAQDISIGTGTTGNTSTQYPSPLPDAQEGHRAQYLFRASELTAAGMTEGLISVVKLNVTALNATGILESFQIKIGATEVTSLSGTAWDNFKGAPVSTPVANYQPVLGINSFTLPSAFYWNGTDNIMIEICGGNNTDPLVNTATFNATVPWTTGLAFNGSHAYRANNVLGCGNPNATIAATQTTRPNITFTWAAAQACTGTPNAGTVVASASLTCATTPFVLSLTGNTLASGITYQWQSSPNNTTWTDITAGTTPGIEVKQMASTYYRVVVKCANSGATSTSDALLVNATPLESGIFTIDNSLPASTATSFKTFTEAYNKIKCGINGPVVFNVVKNAAPYSEQLFLYSVPGASATNTITFNGNGASIDFTNTNSSERAIIKLDGADYFIFDSLTINALGSTSSNYGFGFQLSNNADSNTIKRCNIVLNTTLTSGNFAGIVLNNGNGATFGGTPAAMCDGNTIDRNTILGGQVGVSIFGDAANASSRNAITNNIIRDFYQYGIYIAYTAFTKIEGNDISKPNRTSSTGLGVGIYVSNTTLLANISRNRIHSWFDSEQATTNQFYGIYFINADADPGYENLVANNLIYNIKGTGPVYGIYNSSSNAVFYYYNTISFDDQNTTAVQPTYGYFTTSYTAGVEFKNNIISITRSGSGLKYHFYMADARAALYTVNYNNYYSTLNNVTIKQGYYQGIEYTTLNEWRAVTGFDANSVTMEPVFKNPGTGNFEPTSGALNDQGTSVSVTNDINNAVRSTTKPDMGAYEFTLPSCNTNFLAGEAYANVGTSTCVGKTVMLNLKNNDIGSGLTYQWQSASTTGGPWTDISGALLAPSHTFTIGTTTLYYRAAVSCNGGTPNFSTPVQINIGGYLPVGSYTIDKAQLTDPSGTRNFNSFTDVVNALGCGIAGPVVFNVTPNTYTEQIRITEIPNTSAINTITFQSQDGNPASAILNFAGTATKNYTVQLDSARNVIFRNMTIAGTDQTNGRVFDIMNTASNDSILNCIINAPVPLSNGYATLTTAGIYAATSFKGGNIVIKGNTIRNGSKGIYMVGFSSTWFTRNNIIEENTFSSIYHQAIYAQHASNIKISRNVIPMNSPYTTTGFNQGVMAIYTSNCDSALQITGNNITLSNNTGYIYGIFTVGNDGTPAARHMIMNNKIIATQGLTSAVNGIRNTSATYGQVSNNEISVSSTVPGTSNSVYAAALMTNNAKFTNYYNNSLLNTSPATGFYNTALWVDHQFTSSGGFTNIFNNVIANKGGGPAAFYNYTAEHLKIDYNLIYATGSLLIKRGPASPNVLEKNYNNINDWRQEYGVDMNSIVFDPAFTSTTNLEPDATNAGSWAMQGRGTQIEGNNSDIKGNLRSVTLTGGVPDLGAYEFTPSVAPPALIATPATPAAGTTQVFTMGSDTVSRITWEPGSDVPSGITLKRFSGVLPAGLAASEKSLYYYVDADVTGAGTFKYNIQNSFIDPWLNTLPVKSLIKSGKTDAANVWSANAGSTVDSLNNIISETGLSFADKFTGMTDGKTPAQPVYITSKDSTNKGTRFWAPYGFSRDMLQSNGQQFRFVLAADVATEATVSINGTSYKKTYSIPAGGVITTDQIPRSGINDARMINEGLSNRGILIESNNPISASAQLTSGLRTFVALLMPTGTYTYEYTTLGTRQFSGYPNPTMGTSWVNVVADRDSTVVEITPSGITQGGKAGGVPFRVTLNKGEVYQVLGGFLKFWDRDITGGSDNSYESTDLTGTKVVSVPNAAGECKPIGVFTGSGGTGVRCKEYVNGADVYLFQQTYPTLAWGKQYLTAPLATRNSKNQHLFNKFRVLVNDPATVVKRNGVAMTNPIGGRYYEFTSRVPEYIEADKPVMIAQYMTYFNDCGNDEYTNPGSSESIFYLTPLGYGLKSVNLYGKKVGDDFSGYPPSYTTVIIPDAGLASLTIAGSNTFDSTYAHPQKPGYTVVMRSWVSKDSVFTIQSDSEFTAIAHIPHNNGGYVYNPGFQVPRVKVNQSTIRNVLKLTPGDNTYTCAGTDFRPKVYLPVQAKSVTWRLSAVTGITPSADVVQNNPVAADTITVNFKEYYGYTLNQNLRFAQVGNYNIPVLASYGFSAASCDIKADTGMVNVEVIAAPVIDYTYTYTGCINAAATFTGTGTAGNGAVVDRWNWNFGDNTTSAQQNPVKTWAAAGNFAVSLQGIANDGCVNSTQKTITVNPLPTLTLVNNTQAICPNTPVTFQVSNPVQGTTYSWYSAATGGTALATGTSFTTSTVTVPTTFYAAATQNGCEIATRVPANVTIIPNLTPPTVTVDSIGTRVLRFRWNAVANATGYEVSTNGGTTWSAPSSGATGLTHTVTGLNPYQSVTIRVRALGGCTQAVSTPVTATTYAEEVFIPNSFTPNGDGNNDVLKVYATGIKSMKIMIFNQWGQKVYEGNDPNSAWNGKQNGKDAPMGVYMYVATVVLHNGVEINKKGNINLIR